MKAFQRYLNFDGKTREAMPLAHQFWGARFRHAHRQVQVELDVQLRAEEIAQASRRSLSHLRAVLDGRYAVEPHIQ